MTMIIQLNDQEDIKEIYELNVKLSVQINTKMLEILDDKSVLTQF